MPEPATFAMLMERVRAGDPLAARELVQRYEPALRRVARLKLFHPRLRRLLDSMDLVNSVWKNFFHEMARGESSPQTPEQLLGWLERRVRNKVHDQLRRQTARKRGAGRVEAHDVAALDPAGAGPTPSRQLAGKELVAKLRQALGPDDWRLHELRHEGKSWEEIAELVGGSAEALRKRLERALARVAAQLQDAASGP